MPFRTLVPDDEIERPQRNALEQFLSAMPTPGLAQQAGMLKERLASLGPVLPAARGANDLLDLFGRMGPIGADLNQRVTGALNAAGSQLEAGAAELRKPNDFLPGLSTEPAALINPTRLAQGATHAVLEGLGKSPLGTTDEELVAQGRTQLDALSPAQQRLISGSRTGDDAARFVAQGNQLGEAWAGTGLRDVAEDAAGAATRSGIRRGQRGRRVTPLSPEEQAARAADMQAEEGIFGAIQDLWKRGLSDEADDLRLTAMGKGREGLMAARDYLQAKGLPLDTLQRFLTEEEGSLRLPQNLNLRMPTAGEVADVATAAPLLRPTSLLGNAASGGFRTLQRWAEDSGGALVVDRAATESVADLVAMAQELPNALGQFGKNFKKGGTQATQSQLGAQGGSLVSRQGLGAEIATAGTRLNIATDEFWRQINRAGAEARANARGITDPMDVAELTGQAADFASFAGKASRLADYLGGFRRVLDDPNASGKQKAAAAFMTSLTPYVKTPERVLMATGRLLGDPLVLGLDRLTKSGLVREAMQGNQEAEREVAGRLLVSGLTYTAGVMAYLSGQLHGAPPKDAKLRREMEAAGVQWNHLGPVPLRMLGNFGQAMGGLATALTGAETAYEKGADGSDVARAFVNSGTQWALDESFLRGLSDLNTAITQGRASQFLEESAVDAVTRPLSGVAGLVDPFDPYERERRGTADAIRSDLPGGRFTLPTKVDPATGEPVRREGSGVERFFLGSRGVAESPEGRELARLGVTAREFKPQDKVYGNVQTPAARRALQEAYGRYTRDYVRDTMARPDYKGASDEEKAATLQRQIGLAQKLADLEVGDKAARDPEARYELEWLRTPHYRGVEGSPDQVARQNLEISEAKQLLSEYRQRYGETAGRYRFYDEHPELIDFARRPEIPERALDEEREAVRRRTGATATRTPALVGAGNRMLPTPSPAFTAP